MRYAIVSDIHANFVAWKSVLIDIRSMGADKIICLGDSVGYGPSPAEVLESLYESVDHFVLGNHEAALCGKIDETAFNEDARGMIVWTRERASKAAVRFVSEHPLTLAGPGFRCAHSEFSDAGRFFYAFEAADTIPSWNAVEEPLLFIGHTHRPCIIALGGSGIPRMIGPEDFVLEEGKRFIVNVGSVGQPRDGSTLSSYCLFDLDTGAVFWRRIPFDLDAFRGDYTAAGIPVPAGSFLELDPRKGCPPLREQVNFKPPSTPARNTVDVQHVDQLRRKIRTWRSMFLAGATLALLAAALSAGVWMREKNKRAFIPAASGTAVRAADFAPESNLLTFPDLPVEAGAPMSGWDLFLADRYSQSAKWGSLPDGGSGFSLDSSNPDAEIRLCSTPIHVSPGMRLSLQGYVKEDDQFNGNMAFAIVLVQRRYPDHVRGQGPVSFETNRNFVVKEPSLRRREGWVLAQQTIVLPARSHSVRFEIRGTFKGKALIREVRLELK